MRVFMCVYVNQRSARADFSGPGPAPTHFFFAGPARRKNPLSFGPARWKSHLSSAGSAQPVGKIALRLPVCPVEKSRAGPSIGLASDSGP